MIFFAMMKSRSLTHSSRKALQQLIGRADDLFRGSPEPAAEFSSGRSFRRFRTSACLVLVQIVVADLQEPVERDVDHLLIGEFLREILRAEPKIAVRFLQNGIF